MIEIKAKVDTYLKARTQPSSSLPESEKLEIPAGSVVRATEIAAEASYWRLTAPTAQGTPVKPGVHLALKSHWSPPIEVEEAEDPRSQALRLIKEGKSVSYIAKTLRVGRSKIKRWAQEMPSGGP